MEWYVTPRGVHELRLWFERIKTWRTGKIVVTIKYTKYYEKCRCISNYIFALHRIILERFAVGFIAVCLFYIQLFAHTLCSAALFHSKCAHCVFWEWGMKRAPNRGGRHCHRFISQSLKEFQFMRFMWTAWRSIEFSKQNKIILGLCLRWRSIIAQEPLTDNVFAQL